MATALCGSVSDLSKAVCDAKLDGSSLIHHALAKKVAEHTALVAFLDTWVFKFLAKSARGGDWVAAARRARVAVAQHGQALAGAVALRAHVAALHEVTVIPYTIGTASWNAQLGTFAITTFVRTCAQEQSRSGSALAVVQKALELAARAREGSDSLRAQRLATGLREADLFYEQVA